MNEEILARLERIERRLDALEAQPAPRLAARPDQPSRPSGPPPVYYKPQPAGPPSATSETEDLESLLGSRWLPRAGALAIVAAIAYLVALGLQRGWITPVMVVLGIAVACMGTIGLGLRLRDERAAFGHVLVGLGTAGLYVDTVGAHFYQNLVDGPAMVGLCTAISLASLAYGFWRALPSFLSVGLSGGLLAAMMPMIKGDVSTSAGLLILVTLPAFATGAIRRWPVAIVATWGVSFLASLPFLQPNFPLFVRLFPLDLVLLMALSAWAMSTEKLPASDPLGFFGPAAAVITGGAALIAFDGTDGALHVVGLGLATGIIGALLRGRETGQRVLLGSALLATTIAPFGLHGHAVDLTFTLIALAGALAATRFKAVGPFAAFEFALGFATYFTMLLGVPGLTLAAEAALIGLLVVTAITLAIVMNGREFRAGAGLVTWALITRLAVIGLGLPFAASITIAWIAVCAGLLVIGFLRQYPELRQLGLIVAMSTTVKIVLVDLAGLDSGLKAVLLLVLGLVLLAGGYAYVRRERPKGNLGG